MSLMSAVAASQTRLTASISQAHDHVVRRMGITTETTCPLSWRSVYVHTASSDVLVAVLVDGLKCLYARLGNRAVRSTSPTV